MRRTRKPVRKCRGCGLNLGDRCARFEFPHDMWHNHRKCPGYMNEQMLKEYQEEQAKKQLRTSKEMRRQVMKQRSTEPHYQGVAHVPRTSAH